MNSKSIPMPLAKFPLENQNGSIIVEIDQPIESGPMRVSKAQDGLWEAKHTFESALSGMKSIAQAALTTLSEIAPNEAEIEMGLKLSAESGLVLAKAGGEAHLTVKLVWKREGLNTSQ